MGGFPRAGAVILTQLSPPHGVLPDPVLLRECGPRPLGGAVLPVCSVSLGGGVPCPRSVPRPQNPHFAFCPSPCKIEPLSPPPPRPVCWGRLQPEIQTSARLFRALCTWGGAQGRRSRRRRVCSEEGVGTDHTHMMSTAGEHRPVHGHQNGAKPSP